MASVPTVPTTPAGQLVTAGQLQSLENAVSFLLNPPECRAYVSASQPVSAGVWAAMKFDGESYDTDGMHSTTSNNTRITAQTAGRYLIIGSADLGAQTSGQLQGQLRINGSSFDSGSDTEAASGSGSNILRIVCTAKLNVGDYLELWAQAPSASTPTTNVGWESSLEVHWIASS